jgi:hypothetical protein
MHVLPVRRRPGQRACAASMDIDSVLRCESNGLESHGNLLVELGLDEGTTAVLFGVDITV